MAFYSVKSEEFRSLCSRDRRGKRSFAVKKVRVVKSGAQVTLSPAIHKVGDKMAIDRAREHLAKYGMDNRIIEFDVSSATVQLAAEALGCEPCRIAKSLSFLIGETPILVVAAGDAKVDNHKYKEQFGSKAKMMTWEQTAELIGHQVGGVCPFGINDGVKVYLDVSLRRFDLVYPACGSSNSAIPLNLEELEECSNYIAWVDVCKLG